MKATGIVRKIDDLGRVVIPKEIRRVLKIRDGAPLEIYTGSNGEIILKKYSPINDISRYAEEYAETAANILGAAVVISDTDQVIAAAGSHKKDIIDSKIDYEVDRIIQSKNKFSNGRKIIVPILANGDAIGAIEVMPKEHGNILGEAELKVAQIGADFIARQMEN